MVSETINGKPVIHLSSGSALYKNRREASLRVSLPHRGRLTIRRSNFSVIPIAPRSLMIKKAMPINGHRLFDCQAYPGCIILEDGYIAMIQKEKW